MSFAASPAQKAEPLEFGLAAIRKALEITSQADRREDVVVRISGHGDPQSYTLQIEDERLIIDSADSRGALYGCLEFAEILHRQGPTAWELALTRSQPFLNSRGVALWMQADAGWVGNDSFWTTLLDQMAWSRLNRLDLQACVDVQNQSLIEQPLDYLRRREIKELLLWVQEKARQRGVELHLDIWFLNEASVSGLKERFQLLKSDLPTISSFGFRFSSSFSADKGSSLHALSELCADRPFHMWGADLASMDLHALASRHRSFQVHLPFNGELWAMPYLMVGSQAALHPQASFGNLLSLPAGEQARTQWPGRSAGNGVNWPAQPFAVHWDIHVVGTQFRTISFAPTAIRRSLLNLDIGSTDGYTVKLWNAWDLPRRDSYVAATGAKQVWIHQRDALALQLWGRLGYEPHLADRKIQYLLQNHLGPDASEIASTWEAASRVISFLAGFVPTGFSRENFDGEAEWGGRQQRLLQAPPLESFVYARTAEALAISHTLGKDGRQSYMDASIYLSRLAQKISAYKWQEQIEIGDSQRERLQEVKASCKIMANLASYYAGRFKSVYQSSLVSAYPQIAKTHQAHALAGMRRAKNSWQRLGEGPNARFYRLDAPWHWRQRMQLVEQEWFQLQQKYGKPNQAGRFVGGKGLVLPGGEMTWSRHENQIRVRFVGEGTTEAWLLHKPLPAGTFFHKSKMNHEEGGFEIAIDRQPQGHVLALEVLHEGVAKRFPSWVEETPYRLVPPSSGFVAPIRSPSEALRNWDPTENRPQEARYLLVGPRSFLFDEGQSSLRQKISEAVAEGAKLVLFAPLPEFSAAWQGDSEWDPQWIEEPNGVWQTDWGEGEIQLIDVKHFDLLHIATHAQITMGLLYAGEPAAAVWVLDTGSQSDGLPVSTLVNLLNAHEVPFFTLGEVLAQS